MSEIRDNTPGCPGCGHGWHLHTASGCGACAFECKRTGPTITVAVGSGVTTGRAEELAGLLRGIGFGAVVEPLPDVAYVDNRAPLLALEEAGLAQARIDTAKALEALTHEQPGTWRVVTGWEFNGTAEKRGTQGSRAAWMQMLALCLRNLGYDDPESYDWDVGIPP